MVKVASPTYPLLVPRRTEISDELQRGIGRRIRASLEGSDLTQAEAARRLGVSKVSVGDWCNGKAMPSLTNLFLLAELVNEPVSFLIGDRLPRRNSMELLARDLATKVGKRRLEVLGDIPERKLIAELDRMIGSHIATGKPKKKRAVR